MLPPSGCWVQNQVEPRQGTELEGGCWALPPAAQEEMGLQRLLRLVCSIYPEGPGLAKNQP